MRRFNIEEPSCCTWRHKGYDTFCYVLIILYLELDDFIPVSGFEDLKDEFPTCS